MKKIILSEISLTELLEQLTSRVENVVKQQLIDNQKPDKYYTRKELSEKLQICLKTLDNYREAGYIKSCRIGNRVLFDRKEVEFALQQIDSLKYQRNHKKSDFLPENFDHPTLINTFIEGRRAR